MNRVLVVDDNREVREMIQMILEPAGYTVALAEDARSGRNAIAREHFDVVVTDLIMPGGDGIELILALRRLDHPAKIIVMSGGGILSAKVYLTIAKGFHPDWQLCKPFAREELLAAIQTVQAGAVPTQA